MYALVGRKPRYPKYGRWFHVPVIDGSDDGVFQEEKESFASRDERGEDDRGPEFPTPWKMFNAILDVECRQISVESYQLRSPSHIMTLSSGGFDLYRDDSPQGVAIFEDWCERNGVVAVERTTRDLDGTDYNV